jgi:hypothetical protein
MFKNTHIPRWDIHVTNESINSMYYFCLVCNDCFYAICYRARPTNMHNAERRDGLFVVIDGSIEEKKIQVNFSERATKLTESGRKKFEELVKALHRVF